MRFVIAALALAGLLGLSGCATRSTIEQVSDTGRATIPYEATASADGVDLTINLSPSEGVPSGYDLSYSVSVPGSEPVELKRPNGSLVDIQLRSVDSSEVVFSSLKLDQEAVASQPAGFEPSASETISEGSSSSSTYRIRLPQGAYELTAKTLGPVVVIEPEEIEVR